uniref:Uncharacterized protein n=1 Tax=Arundo donax TaxID=35708 RepID=A0A0A9D9V1_ARUDO
MSLFLWRARRFWNQTATCLASRPSSAASCTLRGVSSFRSFLKLSSRNRACSSLSRRFFAWSSPPSPSAAGRGFRLRRCRAFFCSPPEPEPEVAASAKLSPGKTNDGNSSLSSLSRPIFQLTQEELQLLLRRLVLTLIGSDGC